MRTAGKAVLTIIALYFIVRAAVEPFLISPSKPDTYKHDWGGPTYVGVLFVHMFLGILALAALLYFWRKNKSGSRNNRG